MYILEEKKGQDIIEALLNLNREEINRSRIKMQKLFDESYRGNGRIREPILSIMMWGPNTDNRLRKTDQECKLDSMGCMFAQILRRSITGCIVTMAIFLVIKDLLKI